MADDASRLQNLSNDAFLHYFQQHYLQEKPWTLLEVPKEWVSSLTSAMRCNSPPQSIQPKRQKSETESLSSGQNSAVTSTSTHPCGKWWAMKRKSATSSFSASDTAGLDAVDTPSKLAAWARPSWRWARGSPTWVNKIPEKSLKEANTTIPFSLLSSRNSETMTNRPREHTRPPSNWCAQSSTRLTQNTNEMATSIAMSSNCASRRSSGSCDQLNTWATPSSTVNCAVHYWSKRAHIPYSTDCSPT